MIYEMYRLQHGYIAIMFDEPPYYYLATEAINEYYDKIICELTKDQYQKIKNNPKYLKLKSFD